MKKVAPGKKEQIFLKTVSVAASEKSSQNSSLALEHSIFLGDLAINRYNM